MDIRTIKTFKAIVQLGSFQEAARQLNYAQSTITAHIQKLERVIGTSLFERDNKLRLTKAGLILNEKSDLLMKSYEQVTSSLEQFSHHEIEVVKLGLMEPFASYHFPKIVKDFQEIFGEMKVSAQVHGSKMLAQLVSEGELDFAICTEQELYPHLRFEPLYKEDVSLLLPIDHPLAFKTEILLADLQELELVTTDLSCPFRNHFEHKLIENNILPHYVMEVNNLLALRYYVQANLACSIVPTVTVKEPLEGTIVRKIDDFNEAITIGMIRNEAMKESRLVKQIKEMFSSFAMSVIS